MPTPSPALIHKIAKARATAPSELPLVRQCARVVLAWATESGEQEAAIAGLKSAHGSNWSLVTALQLLSGRRGQFGAECGAPDERATLFHAHLLAKACCNQGDLGAVSMPALNKIEELRRLAAEQARPGDSSNRC
jgi:hypothetical protein